MFQGRTFQGIIEAFVMRNTHLNQVLLQKYTSFKVRRMYENVLKNIETNYPQYIDELRGTAAGAKVPFFKVQYDSIGNRKDGFCLQLHCHVSGQPKRCHSAILA